MPRRTLLGLLATIAVLAAPTAVGAAPYKHTTQATDYGSGGAAATVDSVATTAATDVLRRGGNAVDATVAAAAVLGVTEPFSCGIGGGGFMVIRTPKGKVTTIDSREKSPAAMRAGLVLRERRARCAFNDARYSGLSGRRAGDRRGLGRRAAQVRQLDAEARAARRRSTSRATASWSTRRSPTRRGRTSPWFDDIPSTAALYLDPDGTARDVGDVLRNPDMARDVRADRAATARTRLLPRPDRRGDGRGGAGPADRTAAPTTPGGPA